MVSVAGAIVEANLETAKLRINTNKTTLQYEGEQV
jgi:hypothetical protein